MRPNSFSELEKHSHDVTKPNKTHNWTRKVIKINKINNMLKQTVTKSKSDAKIPETPEKKNAKTPRKKTQKPDASGEPQEDKNGGKIIVILNPPCTTCGRQENAERFHSHPPKTPVKSEKSPAKTLKKEEVKKSLTCYICGREFGSASLQLHEPQCLKKWERENQLLPRNMRRKPPVKPDVELSSEKWNQLAWEASKAALCPCENCGRTFLPDRLAVHQRSCRPPIGSSRTPKIETNQPPSSPGPHAVRCYICGRLFGTKSIGIHEPQCLRKWKATNENLPPSERRLLPVKPDEPIIVENVPPAPGPSTEEENPLKPTLECYVCRENFSPNTIYAHEPICLKKFRAANEKLPPEKRQPEPQRPDIKFTPSGGVDFVGTFHRIWENHLAELVPCKICGRKFFPDRIGKHEKACNNLPVKRKKK